MAIDWLKSASWDSIYLPFRAKLTHYYFDFADIFASKVWIPYSKVKLALDLLVLVNQSFSIFFFLTIPLNATS